ncbi:hypothetical protein NDU88_006564 [Pleurodeles waltl]|uniref:Uncharacterized protein n=1 Tax=Pleurodeles waltl TaxID=8319 RepID=A0AAV7NQL9_PLEWA|nr:hypothetical protein NDU88_006564 [Pleurodeles waltl]
MSPQCNIKKEATVKDLFHKKSDKAPSPPPPSDSPAADGPHSEEAPFTRAFLEHLFETLSKDFATLKQDIPMEVKDLRHEIGDLAHCVNSLEQTYDSRKEELDGYCCELLELRDKNQKLWYQLEDLENRSRSSNICIKRVQLQAIPGNLADYAIRLFGHVAPALADQEIILDRTHHSGHLAGSAGQAQDILTCPHYYHQKELTMAVTHHRSVIDFKGLKLWLYQDLSPITLQQRWVV